ncbi:MAG: uroporphyrinogen decarboxylase family protein [Thermodesulfobacteriota bacterium]
MRIGNIWRSLASGLVPPIGFVPEPIQDAAARFCSYRGRISRLSSLERVLTAIRHKEPDRVPVAPLVNAGARRILGVSFPDYSRLPEKAADVFTASVDFIGGDLIVLMLDLSVEAADFGQRVMYPEESTAHPDYSRPSIRRVDDYARVRPIPLSETRRMNNLIRLCEIMAGRMGLKTLVSGFVYGPLGVLSMMRGAQAFFLDCMHYPDQVKKACEAVTETLVAFAEAQCDAGVPAVTIDTLYASHSALPKKVWESLEGPFAREISRCIRKKGRLVGIHNCGHGIYFDAQIKWMEPQVISFAHLPDDCATPEEMKRRYGDAVTLVGYVPTPLLVQGTPRQVMDECRRQIDVLARDGGFILAPGCEYPPNISFDSAFALVKAAELSGR